MPQEGVEGSRIVPQAPAIFPWRTRLPEQPVPTGLSVQTIGEGDLAWTLVVRSWDPRQIAACRLCDACRANPTGSFCAFVVPGVLSPPAAASFGVRGDDPDVLPGDSRTG